MSKVLPAFLDLLLDAICVVDAEGRYVFVSAAFEKIFGYSPNEVIGRSMIELVLPEDRERTLRVAQDIMAGTPQTCFENRYVRKNGEVAHILWSASWSAGDQMRVAVARDISNLKRAEQAMRESESRFRSVIDASPIPMALNDSQGNIAYLNRAFIQATGYTLKDIPTLDDWWPRAYPDPDHRRELVEDWQKNLDQAKKTQRPFVPMEVRVRCKNGALRTFLASATELEDHFAGNHLVILQDITERKRTEERIHHLAYWDSLTALPNRTLLRDRVGQSIAIAHRESSPIAVLFLDLDHFKNINDSLGHQAGDSMLVEVAKRLTQVVRESDTVGRLGGDEFLIVLPGATEDAAAHVAQKLLAETRKAFVFGPRSLKVTPSIGIAMYPKNGTNFDELLKAADTAMYHAKNGGRNAFHFYADEMNQAVFQRMEMESNLHQAIERNEFLLYYQPKYKLSDKTLIGMEALIRWQKPEADMVSPVEFIPVAEASGLIEPIGKWALSEACRQAREWMKAGLPPTKIAVNFSPRQFVARNIVDLVTETLRFFELDGEVLEIEITESLLAQDMDYTLEALLALKKLGVHIAIDDFGTGYSSLAYLKRFPIDRLKIDQSFIRDLESDPNDRAIAMAVVTLGHSLGMRVIAEGVETELQMDILRDMGCDEVQGYYLGHPMSASEMTALLRKG